MFLPYNNRYQYYFDNNNKYILMNDNSSKREIITLKTASIMIDRDIEDIKAYISSGLLMYIKGIIGVKRIFLFKRDFINYAAYILKANVDNLSNYYNSYDDILSEYPNKLYKEDIQYILYFKNNFDTEKIMKLNMNCKYDTNGRIYADKIEFIELLKRYRRTYNYYHEKAINPFLSI